jgi:hypothetical protein
MTRRIAKCNYFALCGDENCFILRKCPRSKYEIGDHLWVREAWRCNGVGKAGSSEIALIEYKSGEGKTLDVDSERALYYAGKGRWQSPRFMPREASRLTLEVKDVRIEHLQDISQEDAWKEGALPISPLDLPQLPTSLIEPGGKYGKGYIPAKSYRAGFYKIWETLNAKRGYPWGSNPWVYVIEFMRAER